MLQLANKVQVGSVGGGDPTLAIYYDFTQPSLSAAVLRGPVPTMTRSTTANYFDSNGVMQTASANTPRLASHLYNGTAWVNRGYLCEPRSTNLCLRSEELDHSYWTKTRCSITENSETPPNGGQAFNFVEDSTASTTHTLQTDTMTVTSDNRLAGSIYAKANGRQWIQIYITDHPSTWSIGAYFDLQNGVVGQTRDIGDGAIVSKTMEDMGNGWYRLRISADPPTGKTTARLYVVASDGDGDQTVDGSGSNSYILSGAQLEERTEWDCLPSSYIATSTATVTREVDRLEASSGIQELFNLSAGTMACDFDCADATQGMTYGEFCRADTTNEVLSLRSTHGNGYSYMYVNVLSGSDGLGNINAQLDDYGTYLQTGAWQLNDAISPRDGVMSPVDTTVDVLAGPITRFGVGCTPRSTSQNSIHNGHIKYIAYWNVRKPDPFVLAPVIDY